MEAEITVRWPQPKGCWSPQELEEVDGTRPCPRATRVGVWPWHA